MNQMADEIRILPPVLYLYLPQMTEHHNFINVATNEVKYTNVNVEKINCSKSISDIFDSIYVINIENELLSFTHFFILCIKYRSYHTK